MNTCNFFVTTVLVLSLTGTAYAMTNQEDTGLEKSALDGNSSDLTKLETVPHQGM